MQLHDITMRTSSIALFGSLLAAACSPSEPSKVNDERADILDACAPSRIMMILDRSSSMQTGTINGATKWSIARDAVDAVTAEFQNTIEMGLMAFPAEGQCSPGRTLVQPALGQRQAIASELASPPPNGGNWTPMAETLAAAAQEASLQVNSGPGDRYALLVTDGWQWCDPYDASTRFNAVDRVQELRDMGVTTFVVGFGNSVDARALNLMAVAAGTDKAGCDSSGNTPDAQDPCYYQADSPLQLQNALQEIVTTITGELCDGLDNDCDGKIDENLARQCSTSCGTGSESCSAGLWSGCDAVPEEVEVCDGLDNNCDGDTDPGCQCLPGQQQACGTSADVGECQPGAQICDSSGQWGSCTGEVGPQTEICDGKDNDCNGTVDDVADIEICDGQDNDCDGSIDESLLRSCSSACGLGQESCDAGNWIGCDAPPVETDICDGQDNDCDGTVDNDCDCLPGDTLPCGDSDIGECSTGLQTCDSGGNWGNCEGAQGPTTEVCDGVDNDCDNKVDESNGTDEIDINDDVGAVICPQGDDQPEAPSQSDDEPPNNTPPDEDPTEGSVSGCSAAGSKGGYSWLLFLAIVCLRRRKRAAPATARTRSS